MATGKRYQTIQNVKIKSGLCFIRTCFETVHALPQHERFNIIKNLISLINNKIIYSQFEKHKLFTNFKHQALNYPV